MKEKIKILPLLVGLVSLLLISCERDTLIESSFPTFDSSLTIMEFLQGEKESHQLLNEAIVHADFESILEKENITFFLPKDTEIREFLVHNGYESITEFKKDSLVKILKSYIVEERITVESIFEKAYEGHSLNNDPIRIKSVTTSWDGIPNLGPKKITYTDLNELNKDDDDLILESETTNMVLKNGVLHILSSKNHVFGSFLSK